MWWENIIGQKKIINQLKQSILNNRIPHAQIFLGNSGYGVLALAIAFASEILYQENSKNILKIKEFMHSDMHFCFPTISNNKHELESHFFLLKWKNFIKDNPYQSLDDWYKLIKTDNNKKGIINIKEINLILNKISFKSVEGGLKVIIIWMIEKMNNSARNKILKILEEPPVSTYFILISENENEVPLTILSRCQITKIPPIKYEDLNTKINKNFKYSQLKIDSLIKKSHGDWNQLLKLINNISDDQEFENYFITWTRAAVQVKKNNNVLKNLYDLSLILSNLDREKQKKFLNYSLEVFRQALINHHKIDNLINLKISNKKFNWESFSRYIHEGNILLILENISRGIINIEKNANSKILFLNLLLNLSEFLHIKIV